MRKWWNSLPYYQRETLIFAGIVPLAFTVIVGIAALT